MGAIGELLIKWRCDHPIPRFEGSELFLVLLLPVQSVKVLTLSGLLRCLRCGTAVVQRVLNPVVFRVCWALLFVVNDVVYSMSWAWINVGVFFFPVGFCLEFWGDLLKVCCLPFFLRALTYFRWSNGVLGLNETGRFPSLISFSSLSSPLWGFLGFCYPAGAVSHHVV